MPYEQVRVRVSKAMSKSKVKLLAFGPYEQVSVSKAMRQLSGGKGVVSVAANVAPAKVLRELY